MTLRVFVALALVVVLLFALQFYVWMPFKCVVCDAFPKVIWLWTCIVTNELRCCLFIQLALYHFSFGREKRLWLLGAGQKVEVEVGRRKMGGWVSKFRALAKGGSPQFSASGGVGHDSFWLGVILLNLKRKRFRDRNHVTCKYCSLYIIHFLTVLILANLKLSFYCIISTLLWWNIKILLLTK